MTAKELIEEVASNLSGEIADLSSKLDDIKTTVDGGDSPKELTMEQVDISQLKSLLQPQQPQSADDLLNKNLDAIVAKVQAAQKAQESFWTSKIFLGCVAGGILLLVGGTLYLINQRVGELESLACIKK